MTRVTTQLIGVLAIAVCLMAFAPTLATAQPNQNGVVIVEMRPPGPPSGDPFPVGWAILNLPKGDATLMAILPANTTPPGTTHEWVFEGWLADLAPPHRCRVPIDDATGDVPDGTRPLEIGDARILEVPELADASLADASLADATIIAVTRCGSRLSSETGFRGFPGMINRTFQHTYFPASQGLLRKIGRPLGDWAFYTVRHKINMSILPHDVVGVTIEPPGTGRRDFDPRPHPLVALIGRIPRPHLSLDDGEDPWRDGGPGPDGVAPTNTERRRPGKPITVR